MRKFIVLIVVMLGLCMGVVFADEGTDSAAEVPSDEIESPAEEPEEDLPPVISSSVMVGGLVTYDTSYILATGTYSKDRLSFYGEVLLDLGFPTWPDGSSGSYYYISGSAGARLTAIHGGQGILFGLGLAGGYAALRVDDGGTVTDLSAWQVGAVPHFGIRFGRSSGIFGEAVVRLLLPLNEVFAYAGDTPPDTEDADRFSVFRYQAIYMPRARAIGRFYLGVGYTFPM